MQTRTITVDYARPRGYDVGYRAENNFTELLLPVPAELENADSYRVYFESTVGEYLQTGLLTPVDGYVAVKDENGSFVVGKDPAKTFVAQIGDREFTTIQGDSRVCTDDNRLCKGVYPRRDRATFAQPRRRNRS